MDWTRLSLLLIFTVQDVACLRCYWCNYNSSEASCDEFSGTDEWSVLCPSSSSSCISTLGEFEGIRLLTRECGSGSAKTPDDSSCRSRTLGGGARATICSCSRDLCNITAGAKMQHFQHSFVIYLFIVSINKIF